MANVNDEVQYIISAKDVTDAAIASAKAGFKSLEDTSRSVTEQMDAHWQSFKTNWLGVTAAIAAAMVTVKKAWDLAEVAAQYNEHMQMLNGLAQQYGTTATAITDKIREIGDGMISMATAAEVAMAGLAKQLKPDQLYQLAEAAVVLKEQMGMTADEAFKTLAQAMETGREKTLKLAVGVIDLKDRYGEAADKMSDAEKAAKLLEMVMERVHEIQGRTTTSTKSMDDKMESLKVTLKDLELTLGQGLVRAGAGAVGMFLSAASGCNSLLGAITGLNAYIAGKLGLDKLSAELKAISEVAFKQAETQAKSAAGMFGVMTASTEQLQQATTKASAATTGHTASIGEQEKALKETIKALDALSKANATVGEEQLKIAKSNYTESLKAENATIAQMNTATATYLSLIKQVYDERIEGEKEILQAKQAAGAKPADVLKSETEILKYERDSSVNRRAVWEQYYNNLRELHSKAIETMKTKEKELEALQTQGAQQRKSYFDTMLGLQVKLAEAQGKAASDETIYQLKLQAIEQERAAADQLNGEAKIKALQDVQKKYADLTSAVTTSTNSFNVETMQWETGLKTVVTQSDAIRTSMTNVNSVQKDIDTEQAKLVVAKKNEIDTVKNWEQATKTALQTAQREMDNYSQKIRELSTQISQMDKVIALKMDTSQATAALAALKVKYDAIRDKTVKITIKEVYSGAGDTGGADVTASDSGGGGEASADSDVGGWASGAGGYGEHAMGDVFYHGDIVPYSDGGLVNDPTFFPMSNGIGLMGEAGPEAIMPLARGSDGKLGVKAQGGGQVINFNPSININGSNKSPEQLAREIVKPLQREMRRLAAVN